MNFATLDYIYLCKTNMDGRARARLAIKMFKKRCLKGKSFALGPPTNTGVYHMNYPTN